MIIRLIVIHLMALRWTASSLSMLHSVYGFQVLHEYYNKGLTRVKCFHSINVI